MAVSGVSASSPHRRRSPFHHLYPPPLLTAPGLAAVGRTGTRSHDDSDAQQRLRDEQWWFGQLARLRRLRRLSFFKVDGCTSGSSLDWVAACTRLRHLAVRNCHWVLDAYAVHRLPRLRTLNLNATDIDDLTFLRMRNGVVAADGSSGGGNGTPTSTAAASTPVVAALRRLLSSTTTAHPPASPPLPQLLPKAGPTLCHLTELVLVNCPFLSDLSPIGQLVSCRALFASDHRVASLNHLAPCVALESIFLVNYAELSDITALRGHTRLRELYITHSSVRDLTWIAEGWPQRRVLPRLERLTLAHSRLLSSVSALGALPRLRHLDLRDCRTLQQLGGTTVSPWGKGREEGGKSSSTPSSLSAQQQQHQSSSPSSSPWSLRVVASGAISWAGRAAAAVVSAMPHRPTAHITPPTTAPAAEKTASAMVTSSSPSPSPASGAVSLAHLAPTLRSLSLSGCQQLVDASAVGELHQLQYLYAGYTSIAEVGWLPGCRSLRVVDLNAYPSCRCRTDAAVQMLARLPDLLPELEMVERQPVKRTTR